MSILFKNGHLVDPGTGRDDIFHVYVNRGKVEKVFRKDERLPEDPDEIVDAQGKYIFPGFVDLHVHFRDPGLTYKETIKTGSLAAAHGGYTTVCTMPNTKPVIDSADHLKLELDTIKRDAVINVLPIGSMTKGEEGKELSDLAGLKEAGVVAISEDGKSVMDSVLLYKGLTELRELDLPFFDHCEDKGLVRGGVMNEGKRAHELHLPGITNAVEDVIAARDILLSKEIGTRLHLCHVSTKDSVTMIRHAKEAGADISAEVCPHHFTLCDEDIPDDDSNYKMNPPVRSRADREALRNGLADGTIEMIATDHAPHSAEEKKGGFMGTPFGITGLETSFPLAVTELLGRYMSLPELIRRMSLAPARLIGTGRGTLAENAPADLVIADLDEEYEIDPSLFLSMGHNTPFKNWKVRGKILATYCGGKRVY